LILLKVLHIVHANVFGGVHRFLIQLAAQQRRTGVEAQILGIYQHPVVTRQIHAHHIPYLCLQNRYSCDPRAWVKLWRWVQDARPDIIHFHTHSLWTFAVLAFGVGKQCPWVYHGHAYAPEILTLKLRLAQVIFCRYFDALIGVSHSITQAMTSFWGPGIPISRTIYNGLDLSEAAGEIKGPAYARGFPLMGMATRFSPDKGVKEFIDLLPGILRYLPQARFILAGDGPLLPWARQYVETLGLTDQVQFPGFIDDTPRFWASLDFALFTSPVEPFGLRIIEPQAAGTVVLAYANGSGSDEVIVAGETGVLVPWGDREALAREGARLWADPDRYQQIARAAWARLQSHFSITQASQKCLELYHELIRPYGN
jgi:glycosyltransferase involved in cell wall biosynthesis